jgi:hypothetical protein
MPAALGEWRRVDFGSEERSTASFLGAHSLIWEYRKQDQRFLVSIDFPFRGYHPLEVCYGNSGWEVSSAESKIDKSPDTWDWREISMSNEFGSRGFVCYSMMTEDCQPYANVIESDVSQNISGKLMTILRSKAFNTPSVFQPVCFQIQIVCESGRQLTDEELDDLRTQFFAARRELRSKIAASR